MDFETVSVHHWQYLRSGGYVDKENHNSIDLIFSTSRLGYDFWFLDESLPPKSQAVWWLVLTIRPHDASICRPASLIPVVRCQLYTDKMPITCGNFIDLANSGFYDGVHFRKFTQKPKQFWMNASLSLKLVVLRGPACSRKWISIHVLLKHNTGTLLMWRQFTRHLHFFCRLPSFVFH
jgi:hypothetical protein